MGTLLDQPSRNKMPTDLSTVQEFIADVNEICKKTGWSKDEVLKAFEIQERERTNNLYVANGNIFDEQMSGIGYILQDLVKVLESR